MVHSADAGLGAELSNVASSHPSFERTARQRAAHALAPAAFRSLEFAAAEDVAIWTRSWVSVGFDDEIVAPGDILPFTVGHHGVHVERAMDGGLVGRFNKAQHGGCRVVPLQCQTGAKTKCSFTACGYSRDRRPIAAGSSDADRTLDQYLGLRPERLLPVPVRTVGALIAVGLDPLGVPPPDWPDPSVASFDGVTGDKPRPDATHWLECDADWKLLAHHLAAGDEDSSGADFIRTAITLDSGAPANAMILFPNAIIISAHRQHCMIVLQPTALGRTLCRIRVFGELLTVESYDSTLRTWLAEISPRVSAAQAAQVAIRYDPTDPASEDIERGPLRHAGAPAAWLESQISERIQSAAPAPAGEMFCATLATRRPA